LNKNNFEFVLGERGYFGGLGAEPSAFGGQWGSGGSAIFTIFQQNNAFLSLNFCFKTCSDNSWKKI